MRKMCILLTSFLLIIMSFTCVYAETPFSVVDSSSGEYNTLVQYETYAEALDFYNNEQSNYDNLVILQEDKVINMEYGVVSFMSDDTCSLNTDYESTSYGQAYVNGCYVGDAVYLSTSDDGNFVYFKLADDIGAVDINMVELIPYEMIHVRLSEYDVIDNKLYHDIKTDLINDYYIYSYELDDKPSYLNDNTYYYSYDGHYFYEDFRTMVDDYRNNNYDNSLNPDSPYYNYYEYLPHRSYTNYNLEDIENYFSNVLYIDGKIQFYDDLNMDNANDDVNLSQLYGELESFFGYEKIYGSNAMMMLSLATHESAYGKSYLAFAKNNLFGHAAYDSDVERYSSRYNNIDTSVYSHAKYYISRSYAGVHSSVYRGSYFGNQLSGMNVNYSSDPYWGEKSASIYYSFDKQLGFKDKNSYALGIIEDEDIIKIYDDESLRRVSFEVDNTYNYSLILLEDLGEIYKVQVDASYSDEYIYNPLKSIGYIPKDCVDYVINEDKINEKSYKTVTYDFDGGEVIDKNSIEVKVLEDNIPTISSPNKNGYEFIGYDVKENKETNDYVALYKEIESIEVVEPFESTIEYNYMYNLKGGKLRVNYTDGTSNIVDINTNMIESYDPKIEGETHLTINYCGIEINYPVVFSSELKEYRNTLQEYIKKNIASYKNDGTYNLEELNYIKENLRKVDYLTSFEDIRYIDAMLLENTRDQVNYHFKDSKYDVSISGLALSLKDPKTLSVIKPFKDTYYVEVSDISLSSYTRLNNIASAYNFDIEDSLRVSVEFNLEKAKFDNPIVIQVKLQDKKQNKIYSVYHLDDDGNVIKCMTTQSQNYVSFMTRSEGDFMILSRDSVNTYNIEDRYENISIHNSDPDNHLLFIEGGILAIISLIGFIMIIIGNILNDKKERLWNDYKKSLQEAESPQEEKQKN